ncbi:tripartite tricarboxylate transporter substrate binding protein [Roseomonas sp. HJA6]|uniref:Tripartite tricarboxylate transporter substrate binding protein n=1 Tax=Roseomonas alba TaxID=2846776 RepID=A0ABS7AIT0_9PROT|nr:tripartite tricarboxylate transporter substrate binding protein [Neoroseomonas alba]MBW6401642.1 tripartite tricarboxylate transporter substrate binding protein [Neoroseomonas alba]
MTTTTISRRSALAAALAVPALARPAFAQAAWHATRPVRVVVPFPPGGATDMLARLIATGLGEKLGQALVIENRPGANGVVATQNLLGSPPDGHSLMLATADTHTVLPAANSRLPYNVAEFVPVSGIASVVFALVARPGLPVENLQQLIELARGSATPLTYASYGVASVSHAAGEMFRRAIGAEMTHVPYQGAGPGVLAITADQVDIMMVPVAVAQPQRARLKMLGVATAQRFSLVPDVATLTEQGMPVIADAWIGLLAAPRTPMVVAETVHAAVSQVQNTPSFQDTLRTNGFSSLGYNPAVFAAFLRAEAERWGQVVRDANIRVDG